MPGPWAPLPQPLAQTESSRCRNVSSNSPASPSWSLLVNYTYTYRGLNSLKNIKSLQLLGFRPTSPAAHRPPVTGIQTLACQSLHVLVPRPTSPNTCGLLWSLAHRSLLQANLSSCWHHFPTLVLLWSTMIIPLFFGSFGPSPKHPIVIFT